MKKLSFRTIYLLAFIATVLIFGASLYLQFYQGIIPCPLCILQRFALISLGVIFFCGAVFKFKKSGHLILSMLTFLLAGTGMLFAGRQVWLQLFADTQKLDCSASLEYLFHALPLKQVITKIFAGSSECSLIQWQFLSLSLADWSLLCFICFLGLAIWQFCRAVRI